PPPPQVLVGEGGMNREYTVADFEKVCDALLEKVPGMTIATDIICGFPNETEEDFDKTMELMQKYRFHICNISQFYPRPGTPAAKMKRIDTKVVKNRSRKFSALFNSFDPYRSLIGTAADAWVGIEVDNTGNFTVAHLKNYTKVLLPRDDELVGCRVRVSIEQAERFHVAGSVVEGSVVRMVKKIPVEAKGGARRKTAAARSRGGAENAESENGESENGENCDAHNYRAEGGGGECCGGGECGSGGCAGGEEKKEDAPRAAAEEPGGGGGEGPAAEAPKKLPALLVLAPAIVGVALIGLAASRRRIRS
ncbi:hypothetical protein TeGR_g7931, partial [Tetraparma gracilis]